MKSLLVFLCLSYTKELPKVGVTPMFGDNSILSSIMTPKISNYLFVLKQKKNLVQYWRKILLFGLTTELNAIISNVAVS